MKKKQMIAGIILLILCIGGYFGVKAYNSSQAKKQEAETMRPVGIETADVTGFSYVNNDEILSFEREGEDWTYTKDISLDMNEESIESMLETVCELTSTEKITAENISDYGFDEPANTITLETAEGSTVVRIGMYNEIVSKYYLSIDDSTELYLVDSSIVTAFDKSVEDLEAVETTTATAETPEESEEITEEITENEE